MMEHDETNCLCHSSGEHEPPGKIRLIGHAESCDCGECTALAQRLADFDRRHHTG